MLKSIEEFNKGNVKRPPANLDRMTPQKNDARSIGKRS